MKVRFAVIGCGYWGPNFLRILSRHPSATLVAACDILPQKRDEWQSQYPSVVFTGDWKEIANRTDVDAVIITTPVRTHYEISLGFLQAGKHVLCEKPFCTSFAEAKSLAEEADRRHLRLMTGHTFLFHPAVSYISDMIQKGELGTPLYAHTQRTGLGIVRRDVNVVWDLAPHDISIFIHLLGRSPKWVTAIGQQYMLESGSDVAFLILEFPGEEGKKGFLLKTHISWIDPYKTRLLTMVGTSKAAVFNDVSPSEKLRIYDKGVSYQPASGDFAEFQRSIRDGDITLPKLSVAEPLRLEVDEFINAIIEKRSPVSDGHFGAEVVRILEVAQQSMTANGSRMEV